MKALENSCKLWSEPFIRPQETLANLRGALQYKMLAIYPSFLQQLAPNYLDTKFLQTNLGFPAERQTNIRRTKHPIKECLTQGEILSPVSRARVTSKHIKGPEGYMTHLEI